MYAIKNTRTGKWVFGTEYRVHPYAQKTSFDKVLTFEDLVEARMEMGLRQCNKDYEIVKVKVEEIK